MFVTSPRDSMSAACSMIEPVQGEDFNSSVPTSINHAFIVSFSD